MNINEMKSSLQMKDFYFSNYSFHREEKIRNGKLDINLRKEIQKVSEHSYDVTLITTIETADMKMSLEAKARFIYEADDYSREESLINSNTVAIMFPFIRSQVTLLTSQPNMTPIVLPTINTQHMQ